MTSIFQSSIEKPLVELKCLYGINGARVFAKCEFVGPTGSHKDRMYSYMVDALERRGDIRPGRRLIDNFRVATLALRFRLSVLPKGTP